MAKRRIDPKLVAHIRNWLGPAGRRFFAKVRKHHSRLGATISVGAAEAYRKGEDAPHEPRGQRMRPVPHPIHFREGMYVRNATRRSGLCVDWTDHDLDDNWEGVVEAALSVEVEESVVVEEWGWLDEHMSTYETEPFP